MKNLKVSQYLCCLPKIAGEELNYDNVFRVLIVQFMDAHNLDIRSLKKSCIHIAQANGTLIPFEAFNLFYRGERAGMTETIRQEIATWTKQRHSAFEDATKG